LTLWAHAEKLQLVCRPDKTVLARDFSLESDRETFVDFHHAATLAADKMMVMAIAAIDDQLKPSSSIAKIKSFHHPH
jgi:putative exporter of polyketide antibiotics